MSDTDRAAKREAYVASLTEGERKWIANALLWSNEDSALFTLSPETLALHDSCKKRVDSSDNNH